MHGDAPGQNTIGMRNTYSRVLGKRPLFLKSIREIEYEAAARIAERG